jgi:hypothetical protein
MKVVKYKGKTYKAKKMEKVMGEFKSGTLHSGSKSGPEVKARDQAIAIGISEAKKGKKAA